MPSVLELFGGFRLVDPDRRTIRVPDRRARGLIAYLALAERAVPRLALAELLCSEGDEQDQRTALRQAVYVARKATAQPDLFVSVDDQIGLNEALLVSDVRRFQTAIARGDPESLREAVELYRGPLLAGERSPSAAFEDWLSGRRSELLEQVMKALLALAEEREAAGEQDRALALARRASTLDPLREDARRQVMRSLAALGQRAAALREYESGRQLLADELQVSPDDATETLRNAISRGPETLANGPSGLATLDRSAVAGGASPPDRADRGAPGPIRKTIDVRRAGAPWWSAAAVVAILALGTGGLPWWYAGQPGLSELTEVGNAEGEPALPLPNKPSIAVLPFDNMSGDPEQEYFVDGLTYDLITSLARFNDLFVIARHSSFQYKGEAADVREIGRELGVRYVLEGSVHKSRDRLSVTAKLIEAATGGHIWAERYDRPLVDVFDVRDEITREITGTLGTSFGGVINRAEVLRAGVTPAERLRAYDYLLRGMHLVDQFTQEGFTAGIAYLEQAIELDPGYAKAYGKLAISHYLEYLIGFAEASEALPNVARNARTAIEADPAEPWAWWALAYFHLFAERRHDQAIEALEEALALNPNDADMLSEYGWMLAFAGRAEEGIEHIHDAMRLSPRHPSWYHLNLAWNYLMLRDHEQVVATVAKRTSLSRLDRLYLAASYARLNRPEEAQMQIERVLEDDPGLTIDEFLAMRPIKRTEDIQYVTESLKRAGLPEATPPLPDKPSIAVLPFENLSGDPKQERLADGITEDVITDLSRFRELFVIARNSTEVYRGKPVDVRQVAGDLGVQYILEGSLQVEGGHVRVTAQLVDGIKGSHIWAERYDRPLDDVFVLQDDVTKKIVGTLAPSMGGVLTQTGRETARRKPAENLRAYEAYLLGIEHKHRFTEEDNRKAHEFLAKAIELDPNFARAYVGLALVNYVAVDNGWATAPQEALEDALKAAETAVALDPSDSQAHLAVAVYYSYVGEAERGLAAIDKALNLNANDADVLLVAAANLTWFGRPQQAAELADRAVRLNPNYPDWYNFGLLLAYFYSGQYDRALAATLSRRNLEIWDYVYRPLTYAQLGRQKDAAGAASKLLRRDHEYSAERFLSDTGSYARDVELNLFLDSNRKAGLPLCATKAQLAKYPDMKRLRQCEAQRAGG